MAAHQVIVFGLLLAVALVSVKCAEESDIKVTVVPSISEFSKQHPAAKFTPLKLVDEIIRTKEDTPVTPFISDRLLAQYQEKHLLPKLQDVTKNLHYPLHEIGAVISCFEITVDQSTLIGQAGVISGGIGQEQISLLIEARGTLYFAHKASIFGYLTEI